VADTEPVAPQVSDVPEVKKTTPQVFAVPEAKKTTLMELVRMATTAELEVGNHEIQYVLKKGELVARALELKKSFDTTLAEVAREAGIDVKDPNVRWGFDLEKMAFTKQ
jgi:hypothetical protein